MQDLNTPFSIKTKGKLWKSSQSHLLICNLYNNPQPLSENIPKNYTKMARTIALIALFAILAVAFAAPAEEKKETLQTANSIGLGYGLYGGLGYGGLGYGGLYGGYGLGYGGLGYGGLYGGYGGLGYGGLGYFG